MISNRESFLEPEMRGDTYVSQELKAVWRIILDMVEVLQRICNKHHIRWSPIFGSLLGAVRHNGFIPWDDDFDVLMPREDYDRFIRVAQNELEGTGFVLQTQMTDPGNLEAFIRLRDPRTSAIIESYAKEKIACNMGLFVDIYPFERIPADEGECLRLKRLSDMIRRIRGIVYSNKPCNMMKRFARKFLRLVASFGGARLIFWMQERLYKNIKNKDEEFGVPTPPTCNKPGDFERSKFPLDMFDKMVDCPFEYITVPIPKAYDTILTRFFGDWRKPSKAPATHGGLYLDAKRCYKEILISEFGYRKEWF